MRNLMLVFITMVVTSCGVTENVMIDKYNRIFNDKFELDGYSNMDINIDINKKRVNLTINETKHKMVIKDIILVNNNYYIYDLVETIVDDGKYNYVYKYELRYYPKINMYQIFDNWNGYKYNNYIEFKLK
jgi:hypothetical protein